MQWGLLLLILMGQQSLFTCQDDNMILIKQEKTWSEAFNYCRENHNNLVTITNSDEQNRVGEKAKEASTGFVWLGLRYSCVLGLWFWVDDKLVCYDNWASEKNSRCDKAAAMNKNGQHKWFKKADNEEFNFICAL